MREIRKNAHPAPTTTHWMFWADVLQGSPGHPQPRCALGFQATRTMLAGIPCYPTTTLSRHAAPYATVLPVVFLRPRYVVGFRAPPQPRIAHGIQATPALLCHCRVISQWSARSEQLVTHIGAWRCVGATCAHLQGSLPESLDLCGSAFFRISRS